MVGAFVLLYGVVAQQILAAIVVLLYSVLIAGQILAPIALFAWVFVIYLLWRFVRAHERLADAATRVADAETAGAPSTGREREERATARNPTDGSVDSAEE